MKQRGQGIVVMGVAGCGKSSFGVPLAKALGCSFIEGDALHPTANIAKMSSGVALDDADRWPWLDRIGKEINVGITAGHCVVTACSALRRSYRDRLREKAGRPLRFIHLKGDRQLIIDRMQQRTGHFMPVSLINSQFATLEDPDEEDGVFTVNIARPQDVTLGETVTWLCRNKVLEPYDNDQT